MPSSHSTRLSTQCIGINHELDNAPNPVWW
jgi:hypothetical protein